MIKSKFVYVILHYNTVEDTMECVKSIEEKLDGEEKEIVVVDNGSPNGSGAEVQRLLSGREGVHVILNEKNEGFARGNNVGFLYAKHNLKADFIVLLNSDTLILQEDTQRLAEEEYNRSGCALMGPKVITPKPPFDSNPGKSSVPSFWTELRKVMALYAYWLLSYINVDEYIQRHFGFQTRRRMRMVGRDETHDKRQENVQLHGCFWVFTPAFLQKYDGLCDRTFLYNEEDILYLRCRKNGLKTVYLPAIEIFHKEDSSTESLGFSKPVGKRRFIYRHATASKWVLVSEILGKS